MPILTTGTGLFPSIGGGGGLGLQTSLSAFWEMENTSWTDALGVNDLTGNGSPTSSNSAPALVGNYANLTAVSTHLSHANATALTLGGGSFSIQAWVNAAVAPGLGCFLSKNDGGFANKEYSVGTKFTSANKWSWRLYDTSSTIYDCNSATTFTSGWHHIVCTWDGTTQRIYVDNGTADTNVPTLGGINTTSTFLICKDGDNGAFGIAKIDQVGLWKGRVLTSGDVSLLYNSGAGLSYAAMA